LGTQLPFPKRGHSSLPTFPPVYYGQTAGWINMPFGTKVGLGQGHIVLDRDPALTKRGIAAPTFAVFGRRHCLPPYKPWPMSIIWPNGSMGQDSGIRIALCAEVDLGPGHTVVHDDPAIPPRKGEQQSPVQLFDACLSLLCRGRGFCAVVNYL